MFIPMGETKMKENVVHCPVCGSGFLEKITDEKYICSHCSLKFHVCDICNGKGYYQASWKADTEYDFETCETCHGSGFVVDKEGNN